MNHGKFCKRWVLRVRGLNMLSVAVQMLSTLLSHAWMTAKQRKYWAVLREKFDQFQIWLNKTQHLSTGCSNALNLLRACTVDKSSAFTRGLNLGEICFARFSYLLLPITWNDLFCRCVNNARSWRANVNVFFLFSSRSKQFNFRIVSVSFVNLSSWNNRGMIQCKNSKLHFQMSSSCSFSSYCS